jgi:hypothetical protein
VRTRWPQKPQPQPEEDVVSPSALGHGLTLRQAQFVGALLGQLFSSPPKRLSPLKAAEEIGVPPDRARSWASLMMSAPPVIAALHSQLRAQIEAGAATPARWLAEVGRLALVDPPTLKDFYLPDGTLRPPHEWSPEMSAQVAELHTEEIWEGFGEERIFKGWRKRIKLHPAKQPKLAALDMLAKYHKLIVQTLEVTGRDGRDLFPSDQAAADERARETRERMLSTLGPLVPADGSLEMN